ncbi:septal ring lytic transglycosylase RlpA family protein [Epilithonimonas tenax]|uniref:septal ring lytic transglycosylase RlpA family protein n=1 Tax=Epilithonimonas tenax TaxID=191577 RepID=UPI0004040D1B|nr:septal ring lytic transglycosylase RlpA family protein [Epilithonimonas tenax]
MKILFKIPQYALKKNRFLFAFLLISCGSRNSATNSYKSTTVSYYATRLNGSKTASGETYRPSKMTGAHQSLAFGTKVEIVNIKNDKSVIITVNDRGSLKPSRAFDLSLGAFKKIAHLDEGIVKVKYRLLK